MSSIGGLPRDRARRRRRLIIGVGVAGAALTGVLLIGLDVGRPARDVDDAPPATAGAAAGVGDRAGSPSVTPPRPPGATPSATSGSTPAPSPATAAPPANATAPGGRVVDDHGELEVAVVLGENGSTRVRGPVRPGAWISFVNHTSTDQVMSTDDDVLAVEVPLVRLVTIQAPQRPGTYLLTSRTDETVTADLVVTANP